MYVRNNIRFKVIWSFTWRHIIFYAVYSAIICIFYEIFDYHHLAIPFLPLSTIGIAVAFLIGFKNNSSYDRFWEARKIWGGIVNYSRTWANQVLSFISLRHTRGYDVEMNELIMVQKEMIYRHIAWLNALRLHLRRQDNWDEELSPFLPSEELEYFKRVKNKPTQIIRKQGERLRQFMEERGMIDDFRHMEMMRVLEEFYILQGKCERIKNTPLPRQYAFFSTVFVWIFILLLPFGLISAFETLDSHLVWLTIPFHILISWIFMTMEMVGHYSENPFEHMINDVPITALCRTIEIDLKEMLGETELPEKIQPIDDILY